jgi:hypothetical protein
MEHDIGKAMAYQIKKEIAERYFRIRKLIEDDRANLKEMIARLERLYEQMGPAMIRIYSLLSDRDLAERFMAAAGWQDEELPFYDEYMVQSETIRERLLKDMELHGWFSRSKYTNLLLDSYDELYRRYLKYLDLLEEIEDEMAVVQEEIKQFTSNYSLDEILTFMSELDHMGDTHASVLGTNVASAQRSELEKKLALPGLDDIVAMIPKFPKLPKPDDMRSILKQLAHEAWDRHHEEASRALEMVEKAKEEQQA